MSNGVADRLNYLEETKRQIKQSINNLGGTIEDDTPFDEYPDQIQNIINTQIIPQSELDNLMNKVININGEDAEPLPWMNTITSNQVLEFVFQDAPLGINEATIDTYHNYWSNNKFLHFKVTNFNIYDWQDIANENIANVPVSEMVNYSIMSDIVGFTANYDYFGNRSKDYMVIYVPNYVLNTPEINQMGNINTVGWYRFNYSNNTGDIDYNTPTKINTPSITGLTSNYYIYTGYNSITEENKNWVNSINTENYRYLFKSIEVSNLPITPNI